jgi:hypothetical protein
MFDDSSYLDTLREHERSHHPVAGGIVLIAIIVFVVGLCIFLFD